MDAAYKDEVKQNPGLIDEYVQMVQGLCASAGSMQKLCEQVAGPALKKYLTKIDHEDSRQYCTEITLCTPTMRQFMNLYAESDCTACTTFMADLSAIAQYDPPHFKQIFDAIVKGLCAEVGGFESKVCYQEGAKNEEKARQAMINGDPEGTDFDTISPFQST